MPLFTDDNRLDAGSCPQSVPLHDLRQFLYDAKFEAPRSEELARHLENGCGSCQRRLSLLCWSDPKLAGQGEQVMDEIRSIHFVDEDPAIGKRIAEFQQNLSTIGQMSDLEIAAAMREQLVKRIVAEAAAITEEERATTIIFELQALSREANGRSQAEYSRALTREWNQDYQRLPSDIRRDVDAYITSLANMRVNLTQKAAERAKGHEGKWIYAFVLSIARQEYAGRYPEYVLFEIAEDGSIWYDNEKQKLAMKRFHRDVASGARQV